MVGRMVFNDKCYIAHQFQGQKVKGQGHRPTNADTQNGPYRRNGKAQELQSWYAHGGRRPVSEASAMTSKVKGQGQQGHIVCLAILRNLHLVLLESTKTRMPDNRGDLQDQRSRS